MLLCAWGPQTGKSATAGGKARCCDVVETESTELSNSESNLQKGHETFRWLLKHQCLYFFMMDHSPMYLLFYWCSQTTNLIQIFCSISFNCCRLHMARHWSWFPWTPFFSWPVPDRSSRWLWSEPWFKTSPSSQQLSVHQITTLAELRCPAADRNRPDCVCPINFLPQSFTLFSACQWGRSGGGWKCQVTKRWPLCWSRCPFCLSWRGIVLKSRTTSAMLNHENLFAAFYKWI